MSKQHIININSVVLLGISDHYTRNKIQKLKETKQQRIVGGLMGKKIGGQLTINSSFECAYQIDQNQQISKIDLDHLEKKVKLIQTDDPFNHFRNDEFIGWYSTTPNAKFCQKDMEFHTQITKSLNRILAGTEGEGGDKSSEEALYLCITLDEQILKNPNLKEVPITLYTNVNKNNTQQFEQINHVVHAEEGETISIESASQSVGPSKSQFAEKLQSTLNAVNRYNEKIEGLISALDNPAIVKNPVLMRELNSILNSYPQQYQPALDSAMIEQYSDSNITSFLAAISASNRIVQDVYTCNSNLKNASTTGKRYDMGI